MNRCNVVWTTGVRLTVICEKFRVNTIAALTKLSDVGLMCHLRKTRHIRAELQMEEIVRRPGNRPGHCGQGVTGRGGTVH